MHRFRAAGTIVLGISLLTACAAKDPAPAEQPQAASSVSANSARSLEQIGTELNGLVTQIRISLSAPVLLHASKRENAAPQVLPILRRMYALLDEARKTGQPEGVQTADELTPDYEQYLVVFGDKDTQERLQKQAQGSDPKLALQAKGVLMWADWVKSADNPTRRNQIASQAKQLAAENPHNEWLTGALQTMAILGSSTPDASTEVENAAAAMKTRASLEAKDMALMHKHLRAMLNKPITLSGVKLNGGELSTAKWKGKVILVDFWATWCPPCRAALPRIEQVYSQYHDRGLEVLGVSSDDDVHQLMGFLDANKEMTWPQLFNPNEPGWHRLTKEYGIMSLPTMFLIDRKGILRSVDASEDFEDQIPKLVAEG